MYYHGTSGIPKSTTEATNQFERALRAGNARSGVSLCWIYQDKGNNVMALAYMERASELGLDVASGFLGAAYHHGTDGVRKDLDKALHFFKCGAHQGQDVCQFFAAVLCNEHLNDEAQELKYLNATSGYTDAQCHLGKRYVKYGEEWIRRKNWSEGVHLLRQAKANGCQAAAVCVNHIEENTQDLCFHCGTTNQDKNQTRFQRCARCRAVYYCSKECQKTHWVAGHKEVCVKHEGYM